MAEPLISIKKTLVNEGGYVDDPRDSGGETNMGISKREYPDLDIKNLTEAQAVEIYREGYWKAHYSQIVDQFLADKLFDMGVLFGVATTVRILQIVLEIPADGAFGPATLEKLNAVDPVSCLAAFKAGMVTHCLEVVKSNPTDRAFFAGWGSGESIVSLTGFTSLNGGPLPDDRNTKYVRWIFDIEARLRTWLKTTPEDLPNYMFRRNVRQCDRAFKESKERCNAPDCHYPLRSDGSAESLPFIGDVCNLCYFLYHLVASRKHFVDAQRIDDENNSSKRKR